MRRTRRAPVTAARLAASLGTVAALVAGSALVAAADPSPDFPSQQQVDRAKAAVTSTSQQVAELDARYAASMDQLDQVRQRAAALAEEYNGARYELEQRTKAAEAASRRADKAEKKAADASILLRRYASEIYQQSGTFESLEPFVDSSGVQDFVDRVTALQVVGELRDQRLREAIGASETARSLRRNATRAKAQQEAAALKAQQAKDAAQAEADRAAADAQRIGAEQQAMAAELARLRDTSVKVEQARQDGLRRAAEARRAAQEAARRAAEAAARARAAQEAAAKAAAQREAEAAARAAAEERARAAAEERKADGTTSQPAAATSSPTRTSTPTPTRTRTSTPNTTTTTVANPPPPPQTGGVSAVLAYARAQIGKPYLWGGSGPNAFDCSGLTMMAWRQAGVYLTHYTGAQWNETARVPLSDLRPGDLVFYGASGPTSHHMGLYIGSGQMIEAPYTGAYVRYASIYRSDLLPYGGRP